MKRAYLGVIGKPVIQSLSPILHAKAMSLSGIDGAYLRLAADNSEEAIRVSRAMGLDGLNITSPFKEQFGDPAISIDRAILQVGAVNTFLLKEPMSAFNTDIYGVQTSFGLDPKSRQGEGKTALVIGAGGAARASAFALRQLGCRVFVANRSLENAETIAELVSGKSITFAEAEDVLRVTDFIVNTVATNDELFSLEHLLPHALVLDAIYAKPTYFATKLQGSKNYINGLEWLLHQGVRSFELFTDQTLQPEAVQEILLALRSTVRVIPKTISLIGMMGSGKSSVADSLGAMLGGEVADLDDVIEAAGGKKISKIVSEDGEDVFRKLESECLAKVLETKPKIISCGGGVILSEKNSALLEKHTLPVWLWASVEEMAKRLSRFQNRFLLQGHDVPTRLRELLDQRFYNYAKSSELVVPTDDKTPADVARRIAYEVSNV